MRQTLWLSVLALLLICSVSAAQSMDAEQTEADKRPVDQMRVREASDFVVGLNALNSQIIRALDELPTRRVIVLPFPDFEGKYTQVSAFIREQLITAIVATRKYQIVPNEELMQLAKENDIPPMELGNSEIFKQIANRYENDSIVTGSLTDLQKKMAVMSRIIQGGTGEYAGAALVYIRVEDEIAALLGMDRKEAQKEPLQIKTPEEEGSEAGAEQPDMQPEAQPVEEEEEPIPAREEQQTPEDTTPIRPTDVQGKNDLAIYRIGRDMFVKGKYREAIGYFEEVGQRFPESALADNAFYWIGESYYGLKSWQKAVDGFQRVLEEYPYGNKVPAATLKRGYAQEKLGRIDLAIASMEEVINRFGDSDVADIAKRKLQLLRAEKQ